MASLFASAASGDAPRVGLAGALEAEAVEGAQRDTEKIRFGDDDEQGNGPSHYSDEQCGRGGRAASKPPAATVATKPSVASVVAAAATATAAPKAPMARTVPVPPHAPPAAARAASAASPTNQTPPHKPPAAPQLDVDHSLAEDLADEVSSIGLGTEDGTLGDELEDVVLSARMAVWDEAEAWVDAAEKIAASIRYADDASADGSDADSDVSDSLSDHSGGGGGDDDDDDDEAERRKQRLRSGGGGGGGGGRGWERGGRGRKVLMLSLPAFFGAPPCVDEHPSVVRSSKIMGRLEGGGYDDDDFDNDGGGGGGGGGHGEGKDNDGDEYDEYDEYDDDGRGFFGDGGDDGSLQQSSITTKSTTSSPSGTKHLHKTGGRSRAKRANGVKGAGKEPLLRGSAAEAVAASKDSAWRRNIKALEAARLAKQVAVEERRKAAKERAEVRAARDLTYLGNLLRGYGVCLCPP